MITIMNFATCCLFLLFIVPAFGVEEVDPFQSIFSKVDLTESLIVGEAKGIQVSTKFLISRTYVPEGESQGEVVQGAMVPRGYRYIYKVFVKNISKETTMIPTSNAVIRHLGSGNLRASWEIEKEDGLILRVSPLKYQFVTLNPGEMCKIFEGEITSEVVLPDGPQFFVLFPTDLRNVEAKAQTGYYFTSATLKSAFLQETTKNEPTHQTNSDGRANLPKK